MPFLCRPHTALLNWLCFHISATFRDTFHPALRLRDVASVRPIHTVTWIWFSSDVQVSSQISMSSFVAIGADSLVSTQREDSSVTVQTHVAVREDFSVSDFGPSVDVVPCMF